MARAIGNKRNELAPRSRSGAQFVEQVAHRVHDVDVATLVATADVIRLAQAPLQDDRPQRLHVIFDIEPVAHVGAVAVDGQRLAVQGVQDHQRDQLLGEMIGPVVVGAVRDHGRQAEGAVPGERQVVARGLRGRIGGARIVGRILAEQPFLAQGAVDFVRRDMEEAEARLVGLGEAAPVGAGGFQQCIGADDVGLDEHIRARDRAIDVALGGQMHHGLGLERGEGPVHGRTIGDIGLEEVIALGAAHGRERLEIGRVGQLIDVQDLDADTADEVAHEGRSDEAGPAGNDDAHDATPGPQAPPVKTNEDFRSASRGRRLSLSDRITSEAVTGQGMPSAGSSQSSPPSWSGA